MARKDGMSLREVLLVACCMLHAITLSKPVVDAANVTTCSFPAVYGFGDSLIDVGNSIQAFPNQFEYAELNPNGAFWPMHSADRMCDGKLLVDFIYVNQSLPAFSTLNTSMYVVQAGFQDYFFPLYYQKSTTRMLLTNVPTVVSAIRDLLKGLAEFGATQVLVVNLPPLGCSPALLTLYPNSIDKYDSYGCLVNLNKISIAHNDALEEEVILLRAKYPNVTYYLGDFYSVYTDILVAPQIYNITETLKACCGTGGSYNFNKEVTCSEIGKIGNQNVNLTAATCSNTLAYLNWDGIHPSHAANRAAAVDFFSGKHITPSDFGCVVNATQF